MTGYMRQTPPPYNPPTPRRRTWRTAVQVGVAVALAIPSALGVLAAAGVEVPATATALLIGIPAALVVVVSAAMNAYDEATGRG